VLFFGGGGRVTLKPHLRDCMSLIHVILWNIRGRTQGSKTRQNLKFRVGTTWFWGDSPKEFSWRHISRYRWKAVSPILRSFFNETIFFLFWCYSNSNMYPSSNWIIYLNKWINLGEKAGMSAAQWLAFYTLSKKGWNFTILGLNFTIS